MGLEGELSGLWAAGCFADAEARGGARFVEGELGILGFGELLLELAEEGDVLGFDAVVGPFLAFFRVEPISFAEDLEVAGEGGDGDFENIG